MTDESSLVTVDVEIVRPATTTTIRYVNYERAHRVLARPGAVLPLVSNAIDRFAMPVAADAETIATLHVAPTGSVHHVDFDDKYVESRPEWVHEADVAAILSASEGATTDRGQGQAQGQDQDQGRNQDAHRDRGPRADGGQETRQTLDEAHDCGAALVRVLPSDPDNTHGHPMVGCPDCEELVREEPPATDGGTERVWMPARTNGTQLGKMHVDRDCLALNNARKVTTRNPDNIDADYCQKCTATVPKPDMAGQNCNALRERLEAASPEDVGLTPMGDRRSAGAGTGVEVPSEDKEPATDGGTPPSPDDYRVPTIDELDAMRVAHGLSQKELSRRAGMEAGRFNHILHHDVDPQASTMRAFLRALREAVRADQRDLSTKRGPKPKPSTLADSSESPEDLRTDGGRETSAHAWEPDAFAFSPDAYLEDVDGRVWRVTERLYSLDESWDERQQYIVERPDYGTVSYESRRIPEDDLVAHFIEVDEAAYEAYVDEQQEAYHEQRRRDASEFRGVGTPVSPESGEELTAHIDRVREVTKHLLADVGERAWVMTDVRVRPRGGGDGE